MEFLESAQRRLTCSNRPSKSALAVVALGHDRVGTPRGAQTNDAERLGSLEVDVGLRLAGQVAFFEDMAVDAGIEQLGEEGSARRPHGARRPRSARCRPALSNKISTTSSLKDAMSASSWRDSWDRRLPTWTPGQPPTLLQTGRHPHGDSYETQRTHLRGGVR